MYRAVRKKKKEPSPPRVNWAVVVIVFLFLSGFLVRPMIAMHRQAAREEDERGRFSQTGTAVVDQILGSEVDQRGNFYAPRLYLSFRGNSYLVRSLSDDVYRLKTGGNVEIVFHTGTSGQVYIEKVASFPVVQN